TITLSLFVRLVHSHERYSFNRINFFYSCYGAHRHLHSFPTRRSSDLGHCHTGPPAALGDRRLEPIRSSAHTRRPPCLPIRPPLRDRKSTRLNSSHVAISYAVLCLKKKNTRPCQPPRRSSPRHLRYPSL